MRAAGAKLTRKQEQAIAALLLEKTHADAAKAIGIGAATLQRWLLDPTFQTEYRAARRAIAETAIARLQSVCGKAVDALERNLTCGAAGNEIQAAKAILDHTCKAVELLDLDERMREIEQRLDPSDEEQPPD